jgi:hypothetical protein
MSEPSSSKHEHAVHSNCGVEALQAYPRISTLFSSWIKSKTVLCTWFKPCESLITETTYFKVRMADPRQPNLDEHAEYPLHVDKAFRFTVQVGWQMPPRIAQFNRCSIR